jgi:hypothetical protein
MIKTPTHVPVPLLFRIGLVFTLKIGHTFIERFLLSHHIIQLLLVSHRG